MKKILLSTLIAGSALFGQCTLDSQDIKVGWTAYKTYAKAGVKGSFDTIKLDAKSADTLATTLKGTTVHITTASVNTGHTQRDATLVKSFFEVQNVDAIKAKVLSVNEKSMDLEIEMNGVKRMIPFTYTKDEKELHAQGVIDLNDFHMLLSLGAINKACYDLHAGKTWQDVALSFTLKLDSGCN